MKNRGFRLSDQATESYRQIGRYTRERYGLGQMREYLGHLLARCQAIAKGEVADRSCRIAFADDLREDSRFVMAGQHYVVFVVEAGEVVIVDFLHQSADISRRLGG